MNIHPLLVHFPIALLTVYSILELIRRWTTHSFWKPMRAWLVILGTVGAFISLQTGEIAEHAFAGAQSARSVIEIHSTFANITTYIFAVIAACYLIGWVETKGYLKQVPWLVSLKKILLDSPFGYLLALAGFITLGLVGALGGIIVYGPDADFVTSLVSRFLL